MDETFTVDRVAWQRENAHSHYVGTLSASEDGIRLAGRDPTTGIRIGLRIPVAEWKAGSPTHPPGAPAVKIVNGEWKTNQSGPIWMGGD
jgi:hypothetical protein